MRDYIAFQKQFKSTFYIQFVFTTLDVVICINIKHNDVARITTLIHSNYIFANLPAGKQEQKKQNTHQAYIKPTIP
ncbi:hypothetical protein ACFO3O_01605 [Dokdonia ponticola]|uniref:Uncharacterized protein n=1 Tax=Dokdonia ponticola TaxID=2041041 RepID=A0ABV9HTM6_9FLAO